MHSFYHNINNLSLSLPPSPPPPTLLNSFQARYLSLFVLVKKNYNNKRAISFELLATYYGNTSSELKLFQSHSYSEEKKE